MTSPTDDAHSADPGGAAPIARDLSGLMALDPAALPLAGVRVLDLTRVMTGPYCTMMLADLGADVVKVEQPGRGDDTRHWGPPFYEPEEDAPDDADRESSYYLAINRNKRSVALDLKSELGREAVRRLAARSDVVVENFAPGVADRLGFGYEAVRALRPDVVYASISGFGQDGPARERTAYDLILQGIGGTMGITGQPGGPPTKHGLPIADMAAGMFTAFAVAAALAGRERTGRGAYVDASLLAGQVSLLTYQLGIYLAGAGVPARLGNSHPSIAPYDTFRTRDGYVNLAVGNDAIWQRFCRALGRDDLSADARFTTNAGRVGALRELYAELVPELMGRDTADVIALCDAAAVPSGPILAMDEVCEEPQVAQQALLRHLPHPTVGPIRLAGFPYRLDGQPLPVRRAPPTLGQHTAEVLAELGLSPEG
jgi:crotonobetainyl-CoA:carnitine CoA-transferase CaiB-like acyl-CoA transferase